MKRYFRLIILITITIFITGCINKTEMPLRDANEFKGEIKSTKKYDVDMGIPKNITEITDVSSLIIKVKFIKNLGAFNTSEILKEKGYTNVGDNVIYTFYEMEVLDVFKGNLKKGDKIKILVFGGIYENILHDDGYMEELTAEYTYILSLVENDFEGMPYKITSKFGGYLPIKNNELSLHKRIGNLKFYTNGESEKKVIGKIKNSIK